MPNTFTPRGLDVSTNWPISTDDDKDGLAFIEEALKIQGFDEDAPPPGIGRGV